jgi:superfamily II DNA or RNA helicase
MANFSHRRSLLAETRSKLQVLAAIAPAVATARGSLVFTQTQGAAVQATELFAALGHSTSAVYSGPDRAERRDRMDQFRAGSLDVLAARRVLDEGVDVPEADLGIMVSANRGRRQVVQRLGRVIGFRVWRCTSRSRKLISAAADLITRLKPDLRHDGSRPSIVPEASPVAGSGRREASIPDRHSSRHPNIASIGVKRSA